ncbi:Uncharacterized conserved protein [Yersinia frederiksenii]|uniref:Uncharacterized conserved protein n=2 Tax=Yersinia frederiksenii TaxID=29484 RepID=A0A380Q0J0_YERFR|nr:cyclophilin-like fold protein [Yersinia frederiksenii]SUP79308.1 Uncharacterized conserved protein [Yersinia frederiksenii]
MRKMVIVSGLLVSSLSVIAADIPKNADNFDNLMANSILPVYASKAGQAAGDIQMIIKMTIHQQTYEILLADNPTAKSFVEQLPLTLIMKELNGNEKFADLPHALPARQIKPGILQEGELMLYGRQTLVLFYEAFQTSYSYTSIGKVIAPENLIRVVGDKNIEVHFSQ